MVPADRPARDRCASPETSVQPHGWRVESSSTHPPTAGAHTPNISLTGIDTRALGALRLSLGRWSTPEQNTQVGVTVWKLASGYRRCPVVHHNLPRPESHRMAATRSSATTTIKLGGRGPEIPCRDVGGFFPRTRGEGDHQHDEPKEFDSPGFCIDQPGMTTSIRWCDQAACF